MSDFPLWVPCSCCDGFFCTVCDGCTSWVCSCPSIDEMSFDPYTSGGVAVVWSTGPAVLKPGTEIRLCFECSRWQAEEGPCSHCGNSCEAFLLPEPEPRPKTLLEVLDEGKD